MPPSKILPGRCVESGAFFHGRNTQTNTHTHTHAHTYTRTYTHTHTHTYTHRKNLRFSDVYRGYEM